MAWNGGACDEPLFSPSMSCAMNEGSILILTQVESSNLSNHHFIKQTFGSVKIIDLFRRGVPDRRSLPVAKPYAIQTSEEEEREQLNYVTAGSRGKDTRNCGSETTAAPPLLSAALASSAEAIFHPHTCSAEL